MTDNQNTSQSQRVEKHDLRRMQDVLQSLEEQIKYQTSFKYAFFRGAVYGVGTVIGATILIALFGGIFAIFINQLGEIPLIGDLINEDAFERYMDDNRYE